MKPIRVGCSGWNYADWRGVLYPPGCPQRKWLQRYAEVFDTVEVNNTFYRLPTLDAVRGWVAQTPPDFVFAVKSSRYLTHVKRLTDMDRGVARLLERLEPLTASPKMGPMLWQLPGNFRRDDERLAFALEHLPPGRHAFEFRHESWFADDVLAALRAHGVALVIGDHPERPWQRHELTADFSLRAPAPRPSRPARQLQRHRAGRVGARAQTPGAPRGGLRLLQQRLGGVRGPQRFGDARAPGRVRPPRIHPRRDLLCFSSSRSSC